MPPLPLVTIITPTYNREAFLAETIDSVLSQDYPAIEYIVLDDGKDAWGLNWAGRQEHKSGWLPEDFGEGWRIFADREFYMEDNLYRPLETPYGVLWAIKTHLGVENCEMFERENALKNIGAELSYKQTVLHQKEMEINSLIFARFERKIRRALRGFFYK
ncbi:MAG: hypothetical protein CVV37_00935 [Nitrospira bacterium HGW-Nitrospira-1]|nr:MAG: hypothetical protein CVV37_00935 [Nitrospira bacterium HGW-Nitrospira-1]